MKTTFKKLLPSFLLDCYHWFWPFLGALVYRFPSKNIKVIGITGTNGKTTVTHLATDIMEGAGYKVASMSSLRFKIGPTVWKNELKMTMPGRMKIQKFLRQAVDKGCTFVVMEVTSEGIEQHRHNFVCFDTAVFTNLTPEHIESHGSFKNYKKAKGELFKKVKTVIVNLDDEHAEYFLQFPARKKYAYSLLHDTRALVTNPPYSMLRTTNYETSKNGISFTTKNTEFNVPLLGKFNIYNALAAVCVGLSYGVKIQTIKQALEKTTGVPGRMEIVVREPFRVLVDYAHTPDSLRKVYYTLRHALSVRRQANLICVLGAAGGGRDKCKRPEMGKIAAKYCDHIILTNEDPYDEDPNSILEHIAAGFSKIRCLAGVGTKLQILQYEKILDRREAIKKALQSAHPGDTVIITGKGAEPWLMTKQGKIPWDDREVVRGIFNEVVPSQ